ncbi:MAG: hypothetical protein C4303_08870 [candidate division GAL15 bacterium]
MALQYVQEKASRRAVAPAVLQGPDDLLRGGHVRQQGFPEAFLLVQHGGLRQLASRRCELQMSVCGAGEAQKLRGLHGRQQVLQVESELLTQVVRLRTPILARHQLHHEGRRGGGRCGTRDLRATSRRWRSPAKSSCTCAAKRRKADALGSREWGSSGHASPTMRPGVWC